MRKVEDMRGERKIDKEALPVINANAVLTGIVLLVIIKQRSDWYSAIDES